MLRQTFKRMLGAMTSLVGREREPEPTPRPDVTYVPHDHIDFSRFQRRTVPPPRRNGTKLPESWHRACRARAQRARDARDAANVRKALFWRMRILKNNPNADPGRFMPKIQWVKGGAVRVGGKYD